MPRLDLLEALLLVALMSAFLFTDPFKVNYRIVDFLRLKFFIFVKEPKLLYYAHVYTGSFIAKATAVFFIVLLLLAQRVNPGENLALRAPASGQWKNYMMPFAGFAALLRLYYSMNPLQPNLPLRLVFPDAMLIGNAIIISSTLLIAPLTEEVIFRGYLFDVLERSFGSYASILATSALFAMAHMVQLDFRFAHVFIIFVLGGIFGVLRYRTGSTAVPILFHALYNLVYILVGFFNYIVLGY